MSIFKFLCEVNAGLSDLAIQAEADIWMNSRSTLTQGRLFSEELATIVSKMEKVEPVYYIKPSDRVQLLSRKDIISSEIKDSFDWLRKNGNIAAHNSKPIPTDLALTAHRHIFILALWYVESYGPLEIELPVYTMPTQPENAANQMMGNSPIDMSEHIEQLLSAQFESKILPTMNEQFKQLHETINKITEMNKNRDEHSERNLKASNSDTQPRKSAPNDEKNKISEMEIRDFLTEKGYKVVDKRSSRGALWIVGGWELKDELLELKEFGALFKFAKNGSQSTKRNPGWFLLDKKLIIISLDRSKDGTRNSENEVAVSSEVINIPKGNAGDGKVLLESVENYKPNNVADDYDEEKAEDKTEFRKAFLNKELVFPASMVGMSLVELNLKGNQAILQYLINDLKVSTIQNLPEDLSDLQLKIPGVGPKSIERFVKQLEEAIATEKKLIGSGKRKENLVINYRELKKKLGRRPTYLEVHKRGTVDSQEYRFLFDSYVNFLLVANELDKEEASLARRYSKWFHEVENTILRKSYKMTLLLAMLERGSEQWMNPITAYETAPFFYDFYMSNEIRKSIDFADSETRKLWDAPLDRTAQLISRMPMTHWAKSSNKQVTYSNEEFVIAFQIREVDQEILYKWTREICEYRLAMYFERKKL
ncbi:hypothetical protein [Paenibacillus sp. An7]|uniref:hypothetical protein n=1 Tax=Paenibacillus sp. An7 TaxID=2689577 RepID=UPI0013593DF4|nr:hypothetical protein [Paenibacillus sp. An7]